MNVWPQNYSAFLRQLQEQLNWQNHKISQLEKNAETLQKELMTVKQQPSIRIDRVEYKFDQLKIERMDGTLNIGLTPQTTKDIQEFAVNGKTFPQTSQPGGYPNECYGEIHDHIHTYLFQNVPKHIEALENQYNRPLGQTYREMMIQELQKQLEQRIVYYMNLCDPSDPSFDSLKMKETVIIKVKQDIDTAVVNHFTRSIEKESD